jgi:DNA-binding transcriptional MocR family regulator
MEAGTIVAMVIPEVRLDATGARPLYRQLEEALAAAIASGALGVGDRLPSERALADRLGVSRTTAVNAYRELEARGLVRGRVGQGTFVCAAGGAHDDAPFAWQGKVSAGAQRTLDPTLRTMVRDQTSETISFAGGMPALDRFPIDRFRAALDRVLSHQPDAALGLGPTEGQPRLRAALAVRHGARPEQVLVLAGSQQGLDLIARCLLEPGDAIVMDRPGYLGAIQTFRAAGARVIGWDARRADPEELEELLQRYRPKLLYTNPTFHNPTGRTLPLDARRDILTLAARYRLAVVEDEPYRELAFHRPPPKTLRELDDQGLVIQLGTFSKTLAAGLRLGWLIAPEAIVDQLALVRQRCDLFGAGAFQLVVAEMLTRGDFDAHLRTLRAEHQRRHDAMIAALRREIPAGALTWPPVEGGLYLWLHTHHDVDTSLLAQRALDAGVAILSGEHFYPEAAGRHEARLCFARSSPEQIAGGIARLAQVLRVDDGVVLRIGASHPLL